MRRKLRTDKEKNEDIWPTEKKKNRKQKKQVFGPWRRKRTKKEMEENIWRRKIADDANQPTDRTNIVQSAFLNVGK